MIHLSFSGSGWEFFVRMKKWVVSGWHCGLFVGYLCAPAAWPVGHWPSGTLGSGQHSSPWDILESLGKWLKSTSSTDVRLTFPFHSSHQGQELQTWWKAPPEESRRQIHPHNTYFWKSGVSVRWESQKKVVIFKTQQIPVHVENFLPRHREHSWM